MRLVEFRKVGLNHSGGRYAVNPDGVVGVSREDDEHTTIHLCSGHEVMVQWPFEEVVADLMGDGQDGVVRGDE